MKTFIRELAELKMEDWFALLCIAVAFAFLFRMAVDALPPAPGEPGHKRYVVTEYGDDGRSVARTWATDL